MSGTLQKHNVELMMFYGKPRKTTRKRKDK